MTRNVVLAAVALLTGSAVTSVLEADANFEWGMATGYASLLLLAGTLILGPLNVLRRRPNPVSTYLRRDMGIWAALLGVVHVVLGFQRHFGGDWVAYLMSREPGGALEGVRYDPFGLASWGGVVATLLLLGLVAISNDRSLRGLGTRRWKRWQRWNYAVFPLVVLHGLGFQLLEKRALPWMAWVALVAVVVLAVQLAGARRAGLGR